VAQNQEIHESTQIQAHLRRGATAFVGEQVSGDAERRHHEPRGID
jgi:hypothetical protein